MNEVIGELLADDKKDVRICDQMSNEDFERILDRFTIKKDEQVFPYPESVIANLPVEEMYFILSDEVPLYCYAPIMERHGAVVDTIVNAPTYWRNLALTKKSLNKMVGGEMKESFFNSITDKPFSEVGLDYCL